jgi:hypothetical protein
MTDIGKTIGEALVAVFPFESRERLTGEGGAACAAFCTFGDYGLERNIRRVVETIYTGTGEIIFTPSLKGFD